MRGPSRVKLTACPGGSWRSFPHRDHRRRLSRPCRQSSDRDGNSTDRRAPRPRPRRPQSARPARYGGGPSGKVRLTIASKSTPCASEKRSFPSPTSPRRIKWKASSPPPPPPSAWRVRSSADATQRTERGLNCASLVRIHSKVKRGSSSSTRASLRPRPRCAATRRTSPARSAFSASYDTTRTRGSVAAAPPSHDLRCADHEPNGTVPPVQSAINCSRLPVYPPSSTAWCDRWW
mmetsp:Transcript_19167/g.57201  ORF Transcript_19167/g.57201 Transcript_19167/m.57201 type:complete len:234 (-) Transcript_19167:416-1117(-)